MHPLHLVYIPYTTGINTLYIVTNPMGLETKCEYRHLFISIVKEKRKMNKNLFFHKL